MMHKHDLYHNHSRMHHHSPESRLESCICSSLLNPMRPRQCGRQIGVSSGPMGLIGRAKIASKISDTFSGFTLPSLSNQINEICQEKPISTRGADAPFTVGIDQNIRSISISHRSKLVSASSPLHFVPSDRWRELTCARPRVRLLRA